MIKKYFTAKELAGVVGLPTTVQNVNSKAKRENWQSRPHEGQGGGFEYYIYDLPEKAQLMLLKQLANAEKKVKVESGVNSTDYDSKQIWENLACKTQKQREVAEAKFEAFWAIEELVLGGMKRLSAIKLVASQADVKWSFPTMRDIWYGKGSKLGLCNYERADWLPALVAEHKGRVVEAEFTPEAWNYIKSNWLREEKPDVANCYDLALRKSEENGWIIPSYDTVLRKIKKIPHNQKILKRDGLSALIESMVAQRRTVEGMYACQAINGDGYMHNVFIKMPNIDKPIRVKTWVWQDVYSRKILAWRTDVSENKDMIRLSLGDVFENFGVPEYVVLDNTRAAANKEITGGLKNRKRFKNEENEAIGLLKIFGIKYVPTSINNGKGHGQAKPVERLFGRGGFGERIDKHPEFMGAYTGASTSSKPDNYGSYAVPYETFLKVLENEIHAWNAKKGRRIEMSIGNKESSDDIFNRSYNKATIRKVSESQRYLWMLSTEILKVKSGGVIELKTGKIHGFGSNRFQHDSLLEYIGQQVQVKFDPADLHKDVYILTLKGEKICIAEIFADSGFNSREAAREYGRSKARLIKSTKAAIESEEYMNKQRIQQQSPITLTPNPPVAGVIQPMFKKLNQTKVYQDDEHSQKQKDKQEMEEMDKTLQEQMLARRGK